VYHDDACHAHDNDAYITYNDVVIEERETLCC
jgi:hypothetical protein